MKRFTITFAALAALGLVAGRASADPGGYAPPGPAAGGGAMMQMGGPGTLLGAGDLPPDRGPDCYGWSPGIKKFFNRFHGGCSHCGGGAGSLYGGHNPLKNPANWGAAGYGVGGPAYNPYGFPPGTNQMMQGTLVFPHQPFVRSPRDYFMLDLNK